MKVAVLGAGAMGTGIGQIAAQNGCDVVYYDSFPGATDRSKASIEKIFNRLAEKGKITSDQKEEMLGRMHLNLNSNACGPAFFLQTKKKKCWAACIGVQI